MPTIPRNLLSPCSMKRVICHWSEGNYKANSTDLEHYNILIEGDGSVIGGDHTIMDNVSTADGNYAAHTFNCNTGSIGVALCCMVGCNETPFKPGAQPLKKSQWDIMIQVVAELCQFYNIPVTPTTVLGHGEVQKNLGIKQKGKWDPMVWPWDTSKSYKQVGDALRDQVADALAKLKGSPATAVANKLGDLVTGAAGAVTGTAGAVADAAASVVFSAANAVTGGAAYELRSTLLANDPTMQKIAATDLVLVPPKQSQKVDGIEVIQEALNRLSAHGAAIPLIQFPSDKSRGFFGPQTVNAIRAFQKLAGIGVDGVIGDDTLRALDAALSTGGLGGAIAVTAAAAITTVTSAVVATATAVASVTTATTVLVMPGVPTDLGAVAGAFSRPSASSRTSDGEGGSNTDGLNGSLYKPTAALEVVVAKEQLTAKRDNRALGSPRDVTQQRVTDTTSNTTVVQQPDYCWSDRKLPNAVLFTNHAGFNGAAGTIEGEASYFGKFDTQDEGTGTPVFGIVQTNSSVFGVSLPENLLIQFGLATREGQFLRKTPKSYTALVEVYNPKTKRLARVPVVDVGPQMKLKRPADLTVATAAFLQDAPEDKAKGYKLPNIQVQLRVV